AIGPLRASDVGRTTAHRGRFGLRNVQGVGKAMLGAGGAVNSRPSPLFTAGISAAVLSQIARCHASAGPMLVTTCSAAEVVTFRLSSGYRLVPPSSILPKCKAAV